MRVLRFAQAWLCAASLLGVGAQPRGPPHSGSLSSASQSGSGHGSGNSVHDGEAGFKHDGSYSSPHQPGSWESDLHSDSDSADSSDDEVSFKRDAGYPGHGSGNSVHDGEAGLEHDGSYSSPHQPGSWESDLHSDSDSADSSDDEVSFKRDAGYPGHGVVYLLARVFGLSDEQISELRRHPELVDPVQQMVPATLVQCLAAVDYNRVMGLISTSPSLQECRSMTAAYRSRLTGDFETDMRRTWCPLYANNVVPCAEKVVREVVLDAVAHSSGACDPLMRDIQTKFGAPLQEVTRTLLELTGNIVCSVRASPAQLPGHYTIRTCASTMLTLTTPAVLNMLQIPTEHICSALQGQAIVNTRGTYIPQKSSKRSGAALLGSCYAPLNELVQYVAQFPMTARARFPQSGQAAGRAHERDASLVDMFAPKRCLSVAMAVEWLRQWDGPVMTGLRHLDQLAQLVTGSSRVNAAKQAEDMLAVLQKSMGEICLHFGDSRSCTFPGEDLTLLFDRPTLPQGMPPQDNVSTTMPVIDWMVNSTVMPMNESTRVTEPPINYPVPPEHTPSSNTSTRVTEPPIYRTAPPTSSPNTTMPPNNSDYHEKTMSPSVNGTSRPKNGSTRSTKAPRAPRTPTPSTVPTLSPSVNTTEPGATDPASNTSTSTISVGAMDKKPGHTGTVSPVVAVFVVVAVAVLAAIAVTFRKARHRYAVVASSDCEPNPNVDYS